MKGTSWAAESASSIMGPAVGLTRIEGGSGPDSGPSQHVARALCVKRQGTATMAEWVAIDWFPHRRVFVEELSLARMPTSSVRGCICSVFRNEHPTAVTFEERC
jgi:hypothetical protein